MVLRILILLIAVSGSVAKAQVALAADSLTGLPGASVDVPIRVFGWQDIVSGQGTIEWDQQVVTYDTIYQYGLPGMNVSNFGLSQLGNGKLTFSWNEPNLQGVTLPDSMAIFVLRFDLTGTPGTASPVSLTSNPTLLEFVDASFNTLNHTVTGGEVMIEDTTSVGFPEAEKVHWQVFPHPIVDHSQVEWEGRGQAITWRLWNFSGQMVGAGELTELQGVNRQSWRELAPGTLPAGSYWLEWEREGHSRLKKVFIATSK